VFLKEQNLKSKL